MPPCTSLFSAFIYTTGVSDVYKISYLPDVKISKFLCIFAVALDGHFRIVPNRAGLANKYIMLKSINPDLQLYIEKNILPRYDGFDKAHQQEHVRMVISQSIEMAEHMDVNLDMVYAVAAYHDTGLCEGREHHHETSARIIREDKKLHQWFSGEQIDVMADAAEDHRASADHEPRTIYGRIVAEADRFIDPPTIIKRTVQYGLDHYPEMDKEEHFKRMVAHLQEKYGRSGYLRLWFDDSPNARRLEELRNWIDDETLLRQLFNQNFPANR